MDILVPRGGKVKSIWSWIKAWWYHATGQAYVRVQMRCPECGRWVDASKDSWTLWEGQLYHSICLGWEKKECRHDVP